MSLSTKILIWLSIILTFGMITFIIIKQIENSKRQEAIEKENVNQKILIENIIRSSNQYVNADDLKNFIEKNNINLDIIKNDLKNLKADIQSVNVILINSKKQTGTDIPSTSSGPKNPDPPKEQKCYNGEVCPNIDKFGYFKNQKNLNIEEKFSEKNIPIGNIGFSAWKENPWTIDIKQRDYKVINVISRDDNNRHFVHNKFSVLIDNINYDIPISSSETKEQYPESKWDFFNPKLFITSGVGLNLLKLPIENYPNIGLTMGIISYGQYKKSPNLSILQFGIAAEFTSEKPSLIINPINVNLSSFISSNLIDNSYVGPSLRLDALGNLILGLNLSVGL